METIMSYISIIGIGVLLSSSSGNEKVNSTKPIAWMQATKVEYRYRDRTVPRQYHRSYTISITDSIKTITIDSYGDTLMTRKYSNTSTDFQTFKKKLSSKGISKHKEIYNNVGCTGGDSEYIRLYKGDAKYFDGNVYHCTRDYGDLYLPDGTSDLFIEQIPEGDAKSFLKGERFWRTK